LCFCEIQIYKITVEISNVIQKNEVFIKKRQMKIFNSAQISKEEKQSILDKHRSLYNGYRAVYPEVKNEQPLYVYDPAQDKLGATITTKGEVKPYTDYRVNESTNLEEEKGMCSECGGMMYEGECSECGYKMEETKEEYKTGKLSDIYKVEDLGDNEFDYVEGGGNKYGTFEKMHHMKEETATSTAPLSYGKHYSEIEEPYNFKSDGPIGDGKTLRAKNIDEQGFTGGGNAPDFDMDAEPGYDFKSKGPKEGDGPFTSKAKDMDLDTEDEWEAFDFESGGPDNGGEAFPMFEDDFTDLIDLDNDLEDEREELEEKEYEEMTSAFADEIEEQDISGVQGMYGETEKPYAFVSTGPGKAGPYQTHSWGGEQVGKNIKEESETEELYLPKHILNKSKRMKDAEEKGEDFDENEFDISDYEDFDPKNSSWEEITTMTGEDEFSNLGEEFKEKLEIQKNKILEMFNRFEKIK